MISAPFGTGAPRTSWIDRAWAGYWSVLSISPIDHPGFEQLRAELLEFMAADPTNPLNCRLSVDGRRWIAVDEADRSAHLDRVVVETEPIDATDPYRQIHDHAPDPDERAPYKVLIGPDSLTLYVSHSLGDAVVVSSFAVLFALGDVHGLRYLRPNTGTGVAVRLLGAEVKAHYKQWWRHFRNPPPRTSRATSVPVPARTTTDAVHHRVSPATTQRFQDWRKETCPEVSTSALVATAAYRALTRNGVALNPAGCYTLIDLRRYLPAKQVHRPGNLVKSLYIPASMDDPTAIAAGIRDAVESARAVPALAIGAVGAALRSPGSRPAPSRIDCPTMTFNFMMRNPGVGHIPWKDISATRYVTMSYPCSPDNLAVFACGVADGIDFSASFVPEVVDRSAVQRALLDLDDMPALLSSEWVGLASPAG